MTDKDILISDLNDISEILNNNGYGGWCATIQKAVDLLKEQGKAKVVFGRCKDGSFATECGHCGTYLDKAYSICPKCNKELDWNSNQD